MPPISTASNAKYQDQGSSVIIRHSLNQGVFRLVNQGVSSSFQWVCENLLDKVTT